MARETTTPADVEDLRPSLGLEFNRTGAALYVRVRARETVRTREIEPGVLADFDSGGSLVGFEVIGLGKRRVRRVFASIRRKYAGEAPTLEQLALIA